MGKQKNSTCEDDVVVVRSAEKSGNFNEPTLKNIDKMIRRYLQDQHDKETALNNVEAIVTNIVNSFR